MTDRNKKEDDTNNKVVSVGNSWIVCKSQSRSGHVYYFNTETGAATWNLSEAEIEKAVKATKQLDTKLRAKTVEPNGPPPKDKALMDFSGYTLNSQQSTNQPIYPMNELIAAQQMPNLPFSGFVNNNVSLQGSTNNFTGLDAINFGPHPNNFLRPPVNSLNLATVKPMYNPSVWAVPQQIFVAPAVSPLVTQSQASLNIAYNNFHHKIAEQNVPASILNNVQVTNQAMSNSTRETMVDFTDKINGLGQRQINHMNRFKFEKNRTDLRQKISEQRRLKFNKDSLFTPKARNLQRNYTNFNAGQSFVDDDSFKNKRYEETSSKLDLTPLINLAAPYKRTDTWFIVVDADVIVKEFKFLNTLIDSDAQCRLMVPHHVMSQIESYVSKSQDTQVRRILRFLSQQIQHGDVTLGEEYCKSEEDDNTNMLLSTCLKLSEENYHMILLTYDNVLLSHKDSIPINIFTPEETKTMLKGVKNKINFSTTKPSTFIPNRHVKSNTSKSESDKNVTIVITTNKNTELRDVSVMSPVKEKESSLKKTADAAIQTDFDANSSVTTKADSTAQNEDKNSKSLNTIDCPEKMLIERRDCNTPDNTLKNRKIKLVRTLFNQSIPSAKGNEKKSLKWHRRKNNLTHVKTIASEDRGAKTEESATKTNDDICNSSVVKEKPEIVSNDKNSESEAAISFSKSDMSDASSDVSFVNQNVSEHVTVEKTSDIIPNSVSNVDVGSVSIKHQGLPTECGSQTEKNQTLAVMYKVDNPSMEEYLRMKCDEWVSRFTQIMEEVLSVVLQNDKTFLHNSLPPPWTLHEATQCIKVKFKLSHTIKDAADNLSNILFKVSDPQGKINMNIKPSEYMEMYSYGVYLLDSIKVVVNDCEDLQIAAESLKKLLVDIQTPNLDCSTHETFDISQDLSSNLQSSNNEDSSFQSCSETTDNQGSPKKLLHYNKKLEKYNLRSNKKKTLRVKGKTLQTVDFVSNFESSFFTSLKLRRHNNKDNNETNTNQMPYHNSKRTKVSGNSENNEENYIQRPETTDNLSINKFGTSSEICNENNLGNLVAYEIASNKSTKNNNLNQPITNESSSKFIEVRNNVDGNCANESAIIDNVRISSPDIHNQNNVIEPKIIRNFSRCAEFEEKLKKKYNSYDDENILDNEEDYQYITEEYGFEDEVESADEEEEEYEMDETANDNEQVEIKSPKRGEAVINDNVKQFKYVIGMVLREIQDVFHAVKNLCEKYFEECKPHGSKLKRLKLEKKAEDAHSHITNLCISLDSMLSRESSDSNNNIQALLRKSGLENFHMDEKLRIEYSNVIATCKTHAGVVLESLQNIMSALRS